MEKGKMYCIEESRIISTSEWKNQKFAHRKLTFTKVVNPCVTFHPSDVDIWYSTFLSISGKKEKKREEKKFM